MFLVTLSLGTTWAAGETKYLPISVVVGELTEPFPAGAQALIQSKLTQLLTRNGIAGDDYQGQFALTVVTVPLDKDIIPARQAGCHTVWFRGEGWTDDPVDESVPERVITALDDIIKLKA